MLHFHEETPHSHLLFLLIPKGDMFCSVTLLHREVRGQGQQQSSTRDWDSVSIEGHFTVAPGALKQDRPGEGQTAQSQ